MEQKLLRHCIERVSKKFGQDLENHGSDKNLQQLSEAIYSKTEMRPDLQSLKNAIETSKGKGTLPVDEKTRYALARYLDYYSWADFAEATSQQLGIDYQPELGNEGKFYWIIYVIGALILLVGLAFVMYRYGVK